VSIRSGRAARAVVAYPIAAHCAKLPPITMKTLTLRQRQIHLDFHTGPAIPDVGADFDSAAFARTMERARVNSVTVFAKCHHGHLYYKTKHPARHPNLKPSLDLTGAQVKALHDRGIRAPVYISVLLDEYAANTHPEWVARNVDGTSVGRTPLAAGWQVMDMTGPYQEYLADQTREVLERFRPVDGVFFDICMDVPGVGPTAITRMLERGYDPTVEADRRRHAHEVSLVYMERFSRMVRESAPEATVYFNSRPLAGLPEDLPSMTHVEIEALPTGGWGYLYFPKNVRYARTFGKPTMGMTGRFHKSWADFGGLKPFAALKYEVCQMLAYGAACSVGDQLHPRGKLDSAVYDLIGRVYAHAESCEPWTDGAQPMSQIAVLRGYDPAGLYQEPPGGTNDGVTRLLGHLKHQFDFLATDAKWERHELVILPDAVEVPDALARRLRSYLARGGKLLLTGTSGLDGDLQPVLAESGVKVEGESPYQTTYIRFGPDVSAGVPATDHVMYERGLRMRPASGARQLARVVEPYFDRTYRHFSSHQQTPPDPAGSPFAAAIRHGSVITIPYPIFRAYGTHANLAYRSLVGNCIKLLVEQLVTADGPSTMEVTVSKQGRRTVVHLLYFPGDRRTESLDLVEDIVPLRDVPLSVRLDREPRRAYFAPSGSDVPFTYAQGRASTIVPVVEGHQMLVLE
jgi:hypothetical protein